MFLLNLIVNLSTLKMPLKRLLAEILKISSDKLLSGSDRLKRISGTIIGIILFLALAMVFTLYLGWDILPMAALISGAVGFLVALVYEKMSGVNIDRSYLISILLNVLGWGLITFSISILVLEWIGLIGSPTIIEAWIGGSSILILELIKRIIDLSIGFSNLSKGFAVMETKFDLIWNEFKRRKKLN